AEYQQCRPKGTGHPENGERKPSPGEHYCGETSECDGIHASQIGAFLPDLIPASEHGAPEWPEYDEYQKNGDQQLAATEQPADRRGKDKENFLDRKCPENVPAAWKVASLRLQKIDVKGESRQQRSAEPSGVCRDDEIPEARGME